MNAFELNKIIGAILGALVFAMGLSVLSDIIFTEEAPETPAYQIAVADATGGGEEAAAPPSFAVLLASADPAAGQRSAAVCGACHSFEQGGPNKVGPGLYGIVGHPIASHEGFTYSAALTAKREEVGDWTYDALDGFLENPQGWAPGTLMGYAGIKDAQQRANVIAYLRSISPDAPPLPEPEAAPAEVAGAEGGAAAGGADPFTQLVASADPATGQSKAAVCLACHAIEAGAPNKLGPNLHGVFDRPIASAEYDYSPAMRTYGEENGDWTVAHLNTYLEAPMQVVPGTKMSYAGIKNENDRAAVIAWLHSISPDAGPIMETAAPAETAAAPAGEAAAPATDAAAAPAGEAAPAAEAAAPAEGGAAPAAEAAGAAPTAVTKGAQAVGTGVEGADTAGGEGSAPPTDASSTAPASAAAATAGEAAPPPQGQSTAPAATEGATGSGIAPPAANTQLPESTEDNVAAPDPAPGSASAPAAAGDGGTAALPAATSLEGAGGRENPGPADGAAGDVAEAASEMIAEDSGEAAGDPAAETTGAPPSAAATVPAEGTTAPAAAPAAAAPAASATPAAEAPAADTPAPAPAAAAAAAASTAEAAPAARGNVVIHPAGEGRVEIVNPARATN
jgi:cytochrome c